MSAVGQLLGDILHRQSAPFCAHLDEIGRRDEEKARNPDWIPRVVSAAEVTRIPPVANNPAIIPHVAVVRVQYLLSGISLVIRELEA